MIFFIFPAKSTGSGNPFYKEISDYLGRIITPQNKAPIQKREGGRNRERRDINKGVSIEEPVLDQMKLGKSRHKRRKRNAEHRNVDDNLTDMDIRHHKKQHDRNILQTFPLATACRTP